MAYPTSINWQTDSPMVGATPAVQGVMAQGSGNGAQPALTVTQNAGETTQKYALGTLMRFKDNTYGEIEAIYLKGVASTAAGDAVVYDPRNSVTTRIITTNDATIAGPVAVALQPCVASQFGWYAVSGVVPVSTASAIINETLAASGTAGQLTDAGDTLDAKGTITGTSCKSAQDAPGTGFTDVLIQRPWCWEK